MRSWSSPRWTACGEAGGPVRPGAWGGAGRIGRLVLVAPGLRHCAQGRVARLELAMHPLAAPLAATSGCWASCTASVARPCSSACRARPRCGPACARAGIANTRRLSDSTPPERVPSRRPCLQAPLLAHGRPLLPTPLLPPPAFTRPRSSTSSWAASPATRWRPRPSPSAALPRRRSSRCASAGCLGGASRAADASAQGDGRAACKECSMRSPAANAA